MTHRRRLLPKIAVACVLLAAVSACSTPDRVTVTELQPQRVRLLGEHGDPLVILIGVHWTKAGYCSGQFSVKATETAAQVRVENVISREHSKGICPGIGTADETAWPMSSSPLRSVTDQWYERATVLASPSTFGARRRCRQRHRT